MDYGAFSRRDFIKLAGLGGVVLLRTGGDVAVGRKTYAMAAG